MAAYGSGEFSASHEGDRGGVAQVCGADEKDARSFGEDGGRVAGVTIARSGAWEAVRFLSHAAWNRAARVVSCGSDRDFEEGDPRGLKPGNFCACVTRPLRQAQGRL